MAQITVVRCDVCGCEKKDANHWWGIIQEPNLIVLAPWSEPATVDTGFKKMRQIDKYAHDLCSRECVAKQLDRWMGGNHGRTTD